MEKHCIDGVLLCGMLRNGLAELEAHEEEINMLNVFPVPDGDTGSNMRMTLEHGVKTAEPKNSVGEYMKEVSDGMLLGARGNSGVILSQFFKGIYLGLSDAFTADAETLLRAFEKGWRTAYKAVVHPVEGTMLTVMREGTERLAAVLTPDMTEAELLSGYISEMKKTLACTPDMLSVLKEEGVVDSGGVGFITVFEGMRKYLYGEITDPFFENEPSEKALTKIDEEIFNANSAFEEGYCTEFILQLMNGGAYLRDFEENAFIEELKLLGDSIVVVRNGSRVKVHIHTFQPEKVIASSRRFGEFIAFKTDNMQIQRNIREANKKTETSHKPLAVIAVATGSGIKKAFRELGCDVVIDGGDTLNVSVEEFLKAINMTDAERVVVLPNDPAAVAVAEQAAHICGRSNVSVLPSTDFAKCYFALAMDIGDSHDFEKRFEVMKNTIESVDSVSQARASRNYSDGEISCKEGEEIALLNGKVVACRDDRTECVLAALEKIDGIEDKEVCVVFRGVSASDEDEDELREALEERYPLLEVTFIGGGQRVRRWIIGVA